MDKKEDRYLVWLNLHPEDSRYAKPVTVQDLVDMRTGEIVSFTSKTGAIFPLQLGKSFHEDAFIKRGRPQSAKLVQRSQRNGQSVDDFEVHITFEWQTPKREPICWLGIDRGIYNLAAYAVTDDTGRAAKVGRISGRQLRHVQRQKRNVALRAPNSVGR